MKLNIHGKNVTITEAMENRTTKKLSFLDKYFMIDEDTEANVAVKVNPTDLKVEVTIVTKIGLLRAEVVHEDYYAAVDLAIDKLEDQIRRQKTRLSRRHREKLSVNFAESVSAEASKVKEEPVRTKAIVAQKMVLDEAIMQMEMLGHSFFIYTDEETDEIAVVYKRLAGGYGLLETSKEA
ncbi:MAG: ribosome-associated translation inhibitor RaiA [Erysipelotrichaceae bacterium]